MLVSLIALVLAQAAPDSFSPATPTNLGNWLDSDEYPTRAAGLDQSGVTQADIFVGPDGKPQACYVAVSSGVTDLDAQACGAAMKRGRFKPATDDAGNPTNGVYRFRAIWVMVDRTRPKLPADVTLSVSKLPEGDTSARVIWTRGRQSRPPYAMR